jgi:hypothetical protein
MLFRWQDQLVRWVFSYCDIASPFPSFLACSPRRQSANEERRHLAIAPDRSEIWHGPASEPYRVLQTVTGETTRFHRVLSAPSTMLCRTLSGGPHNLRMEEHHETRIGFNRAGSFPGMCIQLGTGSCGHRRLSWRARPSLRGTASGRLSTASGRLPIAARRLRASTGLWLRISGRVPGGASLA